MTMAAAIFDETPTFAHESVMLEEVAHAFSGLSGTLIDATAGGGGHTFALLERNPGLSVVAFDRDWAAVEAARRRLTPFGERARVEHAAFDEIEAVLGELGVPQIQGLLADLGVSSHQLTDAARGMSFRTQGPIDMRMDPTRGETALELIARLSQDELADVIYELGEERASRRIARCIKQGLESSELETTADLRRAIVRAVGPRRIGGVDPATRTFQALRMAVNDEVGQLRALLKLARTMLAPGGVAAVISFHSLEDRLVKREFRERDFWDRVTPKPLTPAADELAHNARSRSAKLRVGRRLAGAQPVELLS
jgi:16S rRNA (cytosine1402-N4)-methyltransferase